MDDSGLYLSFIHKLFTKEGAKMSGWNSRDASELADLVVAADFTPGTQDISAAKQHGMCKPIRWGQSMEQCRIDITNYIESELKKCTKQGLGNALHAAQDRHAGGHGEERYLGLIGSVVLNPWHIVQDATPGRTEKYAVPRETAEIIKKWEADCGCKK